MNTQTTKPSFNYALRSSFLMAGLISVMSLILLISGCATQAPVKEEEEAPVIVWPGPPEEPRIRYLGSLKSLEDVAGKQQQSIRDMLMGKESAENKALSKPYAVHSDSKGRVFVADTGIAGLIVFNIKEKNVSFWGVTGLGALSKPVGVTSNAQGNVFVSDVLNHRVVIFDNDGNYLDAYGGEEILNSPVGLVYNDETQRLYVVDSKQNQIIVFDPQGDIDFTIGKGGEPSAKPGEFNIPTNIATDNDGRLYVSDSMNFRVQIFEADGTFVRTFGQPGDRPGDFSRLKGIGVDSDGHIYTVDASFNNFQIFNDSGELLLFIGQSGTGPAGFYLPAGAHVDHNNRIFIADQYNRRIQMFEYIGEPAQDESKSTAAEQ